MNRKFLPFLIVLLLVACAPALQVPPVNVVEDAITEETPASVATPKAPSGVEWKRYSNEQLGVSFEYPSIYDTSSYQDCGVKVSSLSEATEVSMGYRSFLLIQSSAGVGLQEYVDILVAQKQWMLDSQENVLLGGENGINLNYRFGGSRFGTATVAAHGGLIYAFNFSAGIFCDAPEANIGEGDVYEHWLESFSFSR